MTFCKRDVTLLLTHWRLRLFCNEPQISGTVTISASPCYIPPQYSQQAPHISPMRVCVVVSKSELNSTSVIVYDIIMLWQIAIAYAMSRQYFHLMFFSGRRVGLTYNYVDLILRSINDLRLNNIKQLYPRFQYGSYVCRWETEQMFVSIYFLLSLLVSKYWHATDRLWCNSFQTQGIYVMYVYAFLNSNVIFIDSEAFLQMSLASESK